MTVPETVAKILAVDDEPDFELLLTQRFRRQIREGEFTFRFARDGEEGVGCLGLAVGRYGIVGAMFEVRVVEIHIGHTMACGGEDDESRTWLHQRGDPVDEDEVTKVIGAELRFKAVSRVTGRCSHDAGICDHHVKRFANGVKLVGAVADARERREIEFYEFEAAALGHGLAHDCGRVDFGNRVA